MSLYISYIRNLVFMMDFSKYSNGAKSLATQGNQPIMKTHSLCRTSILDGRVWG